MGLESFIAEQGTIGIGTVSVPLETVVHSLHRTFHIQVLRRTDDGFVCRVYRFGRSGTAPHFLPGAGLELTQRKIDTLWSLHIRLVVYHYLVIPIVLACFSLALALSGNAAPLSGQTFWMIAVFLALTIVVTADAKLFAGRIKKALLQEIRRYMV